MEHFTRIFSVVLIAIGVFLAFFHVLYVKKREVGRGTDTPEERIALYGAIGIGVLFIGGGIILLIFGQ